MKENCNKNLLYFVFLFVFLIYGCSKKVAVFEEKTDNSIQEEKVLKEVVVDEDLVAKINAKEAEYIAQHEAEEERRREEEANQIFNYKVKDSDYVVSCTTRAHFGLIEQKYGYSLVGESEFFDPKNRYIFYVSKSDNSLSFDLTPYMFTDRCGYSYERIYFYEVECGFEIFYVHDDLNVFILTFDFNNMNVKFLNPGYLNYIFTSNYSYEFVYNLLINHKLIDSDFSNFQTSDNRACDYSASTLHSCSEVEIIDGILYAKNYVFSRFVDKILPDNVRDGTSHVIEANFINAEFETKSYLKETSQDYKPSNMKTFSNEPWCPSISYKQEEIIIQSDDFAIEGIYFGNGYYNEDKKYLYKQNSRVKEIEIEFVESGLKEIVELADTGCIQYIPLADVNSHEIKIRILSVYEGEKYNDVCINCIIPLRRIGFDELHLYIGER